MKQEDGKTVFVSWLQYNSQIHSLLGRLMGAMYHQIQSPACSFFEIKQNSKDYEISSTHYILSLKDGM